MQKITTNEVLYRTMLMAKDIVNLSNNIKPTIYGIPRGGVSVALAIKIQLPLVMIVDEPEHADIFVDDIIDSGKTMREYAKKFPDIPFLAMYDRQHCGNQWLQFPWEKGEEPEIPHKTNPPIDKE